MDGVHQPSLSMHLPDTTTLQLIFLRRIGATERLNINAQQANYGERLRASQMGAAKMALSQRRIVRGLKKNVARLLPAIRFQQRLKKELDRVS